MKIDKILKAIEGLSDEEKQQLADALSDNEEKPEAEDETAETNKPAENETEEIKPAVEEAADVAEETPAEEQAETAEEITEEATETPNEIAEKPDEEPIPEMSKGEIAEPVEELAEQPLQDEEGGEMPIDYSQIVDGLNAKVLALEAENKQLKAKVEGAFGLTGKPASFAAVNKLYSDTTDIPLMRK